METVRKLVKMFHPLFSGTQLQIGLQAKVNVGSCVFADSALPQVSAVFQIFLLLCALFNFLHPPHRLFQSTSQ